MCNRNKVVILGEPALVVWKVEEKQVGYVALDQYHTLSKALNVLNATVLDSK